MYMCDSNYGWKLHQTSELHFFFRASIKVLEGYRVEIILANNVC